MFLFSFLVESEIEMKMASSHSTNTDDMHSRTTNTAVPSNRNPRSSRVSISSNKRSSVNKAGANSVKVNHGMFRRAVPQMPRVLAIICFVLNLVLPGTCTYVFDSKIELHC